MYKLIAIDLDDTLLNEKGEISKENKEAIEEARRSGVVILLCSGRPSIGMHHVIHYLGLNKQGEYYVSFNGALISNCHNHETIHQEGLSKEVADAVIDLGREYEASLQLYVEDKMYVEKYTDQTKRYEDRIGIKAIVVDDLKAYTAETNIKVLCNDKPEKLKKVYEKGQEIFGQDLHIFFSRDYLLEFISSKTNKGIAVMHMADKLGIKKDEVIAIGDSYNDIYMIELAGLGVLVSNGREDLKMRADYVTVESNDNHAVKEVIDKFIFNK